MEILRSYFELQQKITYKEREICFFKKNKSEKTEELQCELNELLIQKENLRDQLQQVNDGAERIRANMIKLFSDYIKELDFFQGKPFSADLNQRLVIEKFLISNIVEKLKFILMFPGGVSSPGLLPSDKPWNTEPLYEFLHKYIEQLNSTTFNNLNEALDWFIKIEEDLFDNVWHATNFD